ncbi:MAG: CCA tRNA nucleotidyltransferase, partial [Chloroflexi bacterium]|nr:CCA tRNA nucleotidyltransferase [Chloroflexota bacterium]
MKPGYHLRALALDFLGDIAIVFERAGHSIYLVGGSVRDRILGRAAPDLDLATSALPEEISRLLRQSGGKAIVEIGSAFGTVCARFGDGQVDVTTFRSEWYPDPHSRHPQVQFGTSLRQDLERRDFTINAIAQDISSGHLIDPFDGVGDIARRRVRAVGRAEDRFCEDPLRMMRAIRLAAQLDMEIDAPTRSAIAASAGRLQFISAERIRAELEKILLSEDPAGSLADVIDL